jgi:cobalamin biosynthesis protein CobT
MPPVDNGNWNRKIFYDHNSARALNTAVHILVDWSGSMSGEKQKFAAASAMRAANVFGRCLLMPVMVSSFTTHCTKSDIAILKHFDTPRSDKAMAEDFANWTKWSGGNNDADAVMWAYRRLNERKEPRKLLIVMSDGAPAGAYKGNSHDALLAATRHIQDTTDTELFGLGIKSKAVELYYDNYEIVNQLEDINGALLDVLKRSVSYERAA